MTEKRWIPHAILLAWVILFIVACGTPQPTATPVTKNPASGKTPAPTKKPTLTKTLPPTKTPTFVPTTAPDLDTLLPEAIPLCEKAFYASISAGSPNPPALFLFTVDYSDEKTWEIFMYPHQTRSASEVKSLVCIKQRRTKVAEYTDGNAGYSLKWDVRLVGWPDGKVYREQNFAGEFSGGAVKFGSGAKYGAPPSRDVILQWLGSIFGDTTVLYLGKISALDLSPDGKTLATAQGFQVVLWDVATGQELQTFSGHIADVASVAFSPDGKTLASGSYDKTAKLWDVATGEVVLSLAGHTAVAFSPDGKTLAAGSEDSSVKLWDVATGQEVLVLSGHTNHATSLAYAPDGKTLASGSWDQTVKLWDVATGQEVLTLGLEGVWAASVFSVAYSPDGKILASGSGDKTARLWDVTTGKEIFTLRGHWASVHSVAFSPDGKTVASGSSDGTVKLWDVTTGQELQTFSGHIADVTCVDFTQDGQTVASGSEDGTVKFWDILPEP